MLRQILLRFVSLAVAITFSFLSLIPSSPALAERQAGVIKIFSEIKGIEIFLDERSQGQDTIELFGISAGSHYLKAVKDGVTVFSELVNVEPNKTVTILIKDTGQVKEKILSGKYQEQQEYKAKKLDILLSKGMETTGTAYTYSTYFPGYYYYYMGSGSGWTTSKSTMTETTDWKIVQGGVQQISDSQFAYLVNDKETMKMIEAETEGTNNKFMIGGVVALIGLAAFGGAAATTGDTQLGLLTLGLVGCVFGYGFMVSAENVPDKHYISPSAAAKLAHDYNQQLKAKLGLPENYE